MPLKISRQMSDHDSCSCRTTQVPTQPSIANQLDRLQAEMELLKLGQQSLQYSVSSSLYMMSSLLEKSLLAAERAPASLPQTVVDQDRLFFLLEKIVPLESDLNALSKSFIDFRERAGLEYRQGDGQQKTTLEGNTNRIQSAVSDPIADSNISSNSNKAQVQVKSPQEDSEQEHPGSTSVTESCQKSMGSLPSSTPVSDPRAEVASSVQDDEDVTSPHREFLRAKIEGIRKILVDRTPNPHTTSRLELPGDFSTIDDDIYVAWCTAEQNVIFVQNLIRLIDQLQDEDEQERKRLRDMDTRIYGVGNDSPHRRYLRAKIEAAKLSSWEYIPNKKLPYLPAELLLMDLDIFIAWCVCWFNCNGIRRSFAYEVNLGFLVADLVEKEKEEREYLLQRKKNRN